jgi:putative membrane protein
LTDTPLGTAHGTSLAGVVAGRPAPFSDHAANERTMLAWVRTGIALMAFGFAIARFGLFLREITDLGKIKLHASHGLNSGWFGVALVLLGLLTNTVATVRYVRLRKALLLGTTQAPGAGFVIALGGAAALVALVMAIILGGTLAN